MPRGGARPGSGRPKKPNIAYRAAQAQAVGDGPSYVELIRLKLAYWRNRAVAELKLPPDKQNHNIIKEALDKAAEAVALGAPYALRRLASLTVTQTPYDLSKLTDEQLEQFHRLAIAAAADDVRAGEGETHH